MLIGAFLMKVFLTGLIFLGLAGLAIAQPVKPAQTQAKTLEAPAVPPVPAEPQTTSASYGDWVLLCQRGMEGARQACELGQSVQIQGQPGPIARLAIAKATTGMRALLILPNNVTLTTPAAIAQDDKGASTLGLVWQRCFPGGCLAEQALNEPTLAQWRGRTDRGQISFKDAAGRGVELPFSFRGLAQALDALGKE